MGRRYPHPLMLIRICLLHTWVMSQIIRTLLPIHLTNRLPNRIMNALGLHRCRDLLRRNHLVEDSLSTGLLLWSRIHPTLRHTPQRDQNVGPRERDAFDDHMILKIIIECRHLPFQLPSRNRLHRLYLSQNGRRRKKLPLLPHLLLPYTGLNHLI